jgi:hypothetical protein
VQDPVRLRRTGVRGRCLYPIGTQQSRCIAGVEPLIEFRFWFCTGPAWIQATDAHSLGKTAQHLAGCRAACVRTREANSFPGDQYDLPDRPGRQGCSPLCTQMRGPPALVNPVGRMCPGRLRRQAYLELVPAVQMALGTSFTSQKPQIPTGNQAA